MTVPRSAVLALACAACGPGAAGHPAYPPAQRGNLADDPYRALEDMDTPATAAWVAAENRLTDATLAGLAGRDEVRARITTLFARDLAQPPDHRGSRYFWTSRAANHDQSTVEVSDGVDGPPTTVLDPSTFATDGSVQLAGWVPSADGARLAYGLATGGGDWQHWRIRDVATGTDLPDELANIKYYEPAFSRDGTGVYYSRFPEPVKGAELVETDHDCKVYFHRIGTPVADDRLLYERPDHPSWQFQVALTRDGNYLVISTGDGEVGDSGLEQITILDLTVADAKPTPIVDTFAAEYVLVGNLGTTFLFETTQDAPTKKIAAVDLASPRAWHDVVAADGHAIIDVVLAGDQIVVEELHDAHSALVAYDLHGAKLREIALPGLGSVRGMTGNAGEREAFYGFASFTIPSATYRVDLATGVSTPWRAAASSVDASAFETRQVFFASKDGTRVPMFITARRGLVLDGSHPTLMTGYGWGGVSTTPGFDPEAIAWIEHGGVMVTVNVRGGGEYGEAWHVVARREHQQVKLDDFIAAAEWLIANKWTSAAHLGAFGTSGGGMLVGAVVVQRPDLFGAVAPIAGVLDLLRFQKFGQGAGWQAEFGHPDDPAEGAALRAISPLHNVRARTRYPAMLVVTSDHDVRVPPLHSYKFTAALQAAQAGDAPILLRVETEAGHGGGSLKSQRIDQETELLAFFAKYLGLPLSDPRSPSPPAPAAR